MGPAWEQAKLLRWVLNHTHLTHIALGSKSPEFQCLLKRVSVWGLCYCYCYVLNKMRFRLDLLSELHPLKTQLSCHTKSGVNTPLGSVPCSHGHIFLTSYTTHI